MRIRSFIIAYALVLAIVLFADRRPDPAQQDRYSHIVDLTDGQSDGQSAPGQNPPADSRTRIIAPDSLIPGTWTAGQIPAERLIAPLVVMDLNVAPPAQISLDDIAAWETKHGAVPQGAVVAIRQPAGQKHSSGEFPIADGAAQFLMDARYTTGFAVEARADLTADRVLARQIALHGNYVVEGASHLAGIPATGSLIIVAPAKGKLRAPPVRVLAMVR
jgi:kynurenine formamidase